MFNQTRLVLLFSPPLFTNKGDNHGGGLLLHSSELISSVITRDSDREALCSFNAFRRFCPFGRRNVPRRHVRMYHDTWKLSRNLSNRRLSLGSCLIVRASIRSDSPLFLLHLALTSVSSLDVLFVSGKQSCFAPRLPGCD